MGITSSIQFPPAKPEQEKPEDYSDMPYSVRSHGEVFMKNLFGLFPPKAGESSTNEAAEDRYSEFMRGGCCKDAFKALEDCGVPRSTECMQFAKKLYTCMYSHPDYYQPVITVHETFFKQLVNDLEAFEAKKQRDENFEKAQFFKSFKRF